jgi:hypothetical protein
VQWMPQQGLRAVNRKGQRVAVKPLHRFFLFYRMMNSRVACDASMVLPAPHGLKSREIGHPIDRFVGT